MDSNEIKAKVARREHFKNAFLKQYRISNPDSSYNPSFLKGSIMPVTVAHNFNGNVDDLFKKYKEDTIRAYTYYDALVEHQERIVELLRKELDISDSLQALTQEFIKADPYHTQNKLMFFNGHANRMQIENRIKKITKDCESIKRISNLLKTAINGCAD